MGAPPRAEPRWTLRISLQRQICSEECSMQLVQLMARPFHAWSEFLFGPQDWFGRKRQPKFRAPLHGHARVSVAAIQAATGVGLPIAKKARGTKLPGIG